MVDIAPVGEDEVQRILREYGMELHRFSRIRGGFSSCNVRCEVLSSAGPITMMLKLANEEHSLEDIQLQVAIFQHLQQLHFPTNYLHALEAGGFIASERKGLLLDFVDGTPGDKLMDNHAQDAAGIATILESLGTTLATLHEGCLAEHLGEVRGIKSGFPVSNTGDLLLPGKVEAQLASPVVQGHSMVAFVLDRLPRVRTIYSAAEALRLPSGLIHGDAFLDNTLYNAESLELEALVDWEDACNAPFVLDLAVAMAGNCFNACNEIEFSRVKALLHGYVAKRPLNVEELSSLPDFLWAAVLACGAWRFSNFNVDHPDSPEATKNSYQGMQKRIQVLEEAAVTSELRAALGL